MSVVYSGALEVDFKGVPVSTHFIAYAGYAAIVGIGRYVHANLPWIPPGNVMIATKPPFLVVSAIRPPSPPT